MSSDTSAAGVDLRVVVAEVYEDVARRRATSS